MKTNGSHSVTRAERARIERVDQLVARGEDVPELLEMLADPSWTVRRAVVAGLAVLGDAALEPLVDLVENRRDDETRLAAAVDALVASTADAGAAAVRLARHPNVAVVADAAQILGRRRSSEAVPLLADLVTGEDDNVALAAIEALGRIGGRSAIDALIAAVESGSFFRTYPAIDVLGRTGDVRAVAPLAALLESPYYCAEAARALGRTGERSAVGPLVKLLASQGVSYVRHAAVALHELLQRHEARHGVVDPIEDAIRAAAPGPNLVHRLTEAVSGADPGEQLALCVLIGVLGTAEILPTLASLAGVTPHVAEAVSVMVRRFGAEGDEQIVRVLLEGDAAAKLLVLPLIGRSTARFAVTACLRDEDDTVRAAACATLARIGDQETVRSLFDTLSDPNPRVMFAALNAIQAIGGAEAERLALANVRAETPAVRRGAYSVLAYFGFASALEVFLSSIDDPDLRVRGLALQGLALHQDRRAVEALLAAVRHPNEHTRAAAMRALAQLRGEPRVRAVLLEGLRDADPWVRYYACQSVGRQQIEGAAGMLTDRLRDEAGHVRVAAIEALAELSSEPARSALLAAARSDDPDVRRAALVGLGSSRQPAALPVLLEAAAAVDPATRLIAVSSLAELDDRQVVEALAVAAGDPDEHVESAAIELLAKRPGLEASDALVALLARGKRVDRVVRALSQALPGRIEALEASLVYAGDDLAPLLISALSRMRSSDGYRAIERAFKQANAAARKAAAEAIAAHDGENGRGLLAHGARSDPDPEVRRVCTMLSGM